MRAFSLTTLVTVLALVAGSVTPAAAADAAVGNLPMPVEQIIDNFIAKETEFAGARGNYTYRQTVKILEYTDSGRVRGKYEIVQDIGWTFWGSSSHFGIHWGFRRFLARERSGAQPSGGPSGFFSPC